MEATWENIELLIVGAGTMGASLAQNYAQNGFCTGMLDVSEEALARGFQAIDLALAEARGKIFSPQETHGIRSRIIGGTSYNDLSRSRSLRLVIEAATERIDIKTEIFRCLDQRTAPHVVLATNSSSLDTNILARATRRPDKVVWMHYFYLPHKNRAAEYAGTDTASPESKSIAQKYLKLGGKISTFINGSRKGGVADIVFVSLLLEAVRMVEEGLPIATIEEAGKRAYGMPMGFLTLMDATGLPIGLYSMHSFSDPSNPQDPLYKAYGNFFEPPENYIALVDRYERAADKSSVRWIENDAQANTSPDDRRVGELTDRFLAVGFVTAAECVDSGLITIEDVEILAQNAFLWPEGPFTIMKEMGSTGVRNAVRQREAVAKSRGQNFPVCGLLKKAMGSESVWSFSLRRVVSEKECGGVVRRITLSNPRTSNAMDNMVFKELERQFGEANDDQDCRVIIFDTAPIKTFIAGADVRQFVERIKAKNFEAIRRDTAEWQRILFRVMTGTKKPKVALVDGQAFGGGVEVACAFALDPHAVVLITNRTSFSLPETRLGIYPGLRGTLTLPQLIFRHTNDEEKAVALARYYILAGGIATSSPQIIYHLGCADAIVPQHRRDEAADAVARAMLEQQGMISREQLDALKFERLETRLPRNSEVELQLAVDLFSQPDLLPTLHAQGRGHLPLSYSGDMKNTAQRAARRVADNSPNAVAVANYLIARGFEGFLGQIDNDSLAAFELDHYLEQVFEHPDALAGLEAMLAGRFPSFKRRYPF